MTTVILPPTRARAQATANATAHATRALEAFQAGDRDATLAAQARAACWEQRADNMQHAGL